MAVSNPFEEINSRLDRLEKLLTDLSEKEFVSQHSNDSDQWFDLKGLIEYLPSHPRPQTVYDWVGKKIIPYHKAPDTKMLLFSKKEIDAWMKVDRRKTQHEKSDLVNNYLKNKNYKNGGKLKTR